MRPRPGLLRRGPPRGEAAGRPPRPRCGRRAFSLSLARAMESAQPWSRSGRTRPQLPFLVIPSPSRPSAATAAPQQRCFTTQRRQWWRYEVLAFAKYTLYVWAAVGCLVVGQFVLQQEWMEQAHPTPAEWSFLSRMRLRGALSERDGGEDDGSGSGSGSGDSSGQPDTSSNDELATDVRIIDHVRMIQILQDLIARLEDPGIDGGGLGASATETTTTTEAPPLPSFDIRPKSEPWRRGYFEALLAAAEAAEHVEGWVRDRTRNLVCPPDMVVGPSNPHPRPLPPGASGAPREEDCEPCFPAPAVLYRKLLHTRGLSVRQQMAAALAFANYLEYKQDLTAAEEVYGRAIGLVSKTRGDARTASAWTRAWTEDPSLADVSQNLLATLTAYATFKARTGDVAAALSVFAALLQARRTDASLFRRLVALVTPPAYPPAPDDGFGPPLPGPQARCDEAALHLHVGEILYATAGDKDSKDRKEKRAEGIAWTREAVDMAEEQLRALQNEDVRAKKRHGLLPTSLFVDPPDNGKTKARTSCRQCLATGLDNWSAMVRQLARDEERRQTAAKTAGKTAGWLPFWHSVGADGQTGGNDGQNKLGRWAAEEKVIQDRRRRDRDLLEVAPPQQKGPLSMLVA
ncbi:hypothetical protein CMQ_2269 [Grosmannia clavigera kw1407]|uniref:Uncharacterized protein n=1 Tax=Grosmannia clavigera (strain kw1407 / UAMH 11150) TaxID=655863 RepID=F0XJ55_GROCL|nr:uncharacterized protein CMQ_2269 [Grosmannia clavigera kw1407]EFX02220.1 hypothetical protein CMQ_2269 [Grosmannia clavigera kw1407]